MIYKIVQENKNCKLKQEAIFLSIYSIFINIV